MAGIASVFDIHTRHLLCVWHVNKAVTAHCKHAFYDTGKWEDFYTDWQRVIYASTRIIYEAEWDQFQEKYNQYPEEVQYLWETWLRPYADRLIAFSTNKYLHFGLTVTSRAEGAHSILKKYLQVSVLI